MLHKEYCDLLLKIEFACDAGHAALSTFRVLLTVDGADIGNWEVGHEGVIWTSVIDYNDVGDSVATSMTALTLLDDERRHCRIIALL